jgi:hypothetical protein
MTVGSRSISELGQRSNMRALASVIMGFGSLLATAYIAFFFVGFFFFPAGAGFLLTVPVAIVALRWALPTKGSALRMTGAILNVLALLGTLASIFVLSSTTVDYTCHENACSLGPWDSGSPDLEGVVPIDDWKSVGEGSRYKLT